MPNTIVTGQLTDNYGLIWSNAKIQISFQPNPNQPGPYCFDGDCGTTWQTISNGNTDGVGFFTVSLPDNNDIAPAGSMWRFAISPNADAPSVILVLPISGPMQDITAQFRAVVTNYITQSLAVPRSYAVFTTTSEPPDDGQLIFDTSNQQFYYWSVGNWNLLVASAPPETGFVQFNPLGSQAIVQPPGTSFFINLSGSGQFRVSGGPTIVDNLLIGTLDTTYLLHISGGGVANQISIDTPDSTQAAIIRYATPGQVWQAGALGINSGGFIETGGFFINDETNNVQAFYLSLKTGNLAIAGSVTAPWFVATQLFTFEGSAELDQSAVLEFDPTIQQGSVTARSNTAANAGFRISGYNGSALGHTVIDYILCDPTTGVTISPRITTPGAFSATGAGSFGGNGFFGGTLNVGALQIAGAAPVNNILVGNGTSYVPTPITSISRTIVAAPVDVSPSRVFGTTYTNTGTSVLVVSGAGRTSGGTTGSMQGQIGPPASTPSIQMCAQTNGATVNNGAIGFNFIVPAGWVYRVNANNLANPGDTGVTGISSWVETPLTVV